MMHECWKPWELCHTTFHSSSGKMSKHSFYMNKQATSILLKTVQWVENAYNVMQSYHQSAHMVKYSSCRWNNAVQRQIIVYMLYHTNLLREKTNFCHCTNTVQLLRTYLKIFHHYVWRFSLNILLFVCKFCHHCGEKLPLLSINIVAIVCTYVIV